MTKTPSPTRRDTSATLSLRNRVDSPLRFCVKGFSCIAFMIANSNRAFVFPRLRVFLGSFLIIAAGIAIAGGIGLSHAIRERTGDNALHLKIAPWVIEHTVNGQEAELFVVLADQADLSGAAALATKDEKGRFVHDALWDKAQTTQAPIVQWLREF